jgi:hypothetical protein
MKGILLFFLFTPVFLFSQELKLVRSTDLKVDHFIGIDSYKNTYIIEDGVFHKTGPDGSPVFNDFQLGSISTVDIINPLKIVLFYEDMNTVVFLDNKLNEIERINFNNLTDYINISTATNAGNNRLWIFNIISQQLELYNYRANTKATVSQPFAGKVISQASNFNYCYALTENKLRAFNVYGSLLFEIEAKGFTKIVQHEKTVVGLKGNELFFISENSIKPIKLPVYENLIKELQLTKDFLYIYDGKKLHEFSITQPKQ